MTVDTLDRRAALELVNEHDVVWVHRIMTANVLGIYRWPHSVIDVDDLPSQVYRPTADVGISLARRLLDLRMSRIWRRREATLAERFAVVLVCREDDRRYLGLSRVRVLPNGFERVAPIETQPTMPPRSGSIGTFKYSLNVDGLQWFCLDLWPIIRRSLPDARLRLISEASETARQWGDDVEPLGRLDELGRRSPRGGRRLFVCEPGLACASSLPKLLLGDAQPSRRLSERMGMTSTMARSSSSPTTPPDSRLTVSS